MNDFDPNELLFFWCYRDWLDGANKPSKAAMKPPNQSFNRSGLGGACWFVLLPVPDSANGRDRRTRNRRRLCTGVIAVKVENLPSPHAVGGKEYKFVIEHDPLRHNYQHCELRVYCDGESKDEISKVVKSYYRVRLAQAANVMLRPEVAERQD